VGWVTGSQGSARTATRWDIDPAVVARLIEKGGVYNATRARRVVYEDLDALSPEHVRAEHRGGSVSAAR